MSEAGDDQEEKIHASGFPGWGPPTLCGGQGPTPAGGCGEITCDDCNDILASPDGLAKRCAALEAQGIKPPRPGERGRYWAITANHPEEDPHQ